VDWPNFFRGIIFSFLPKPYWRSWRPSSTVDFARSAVVSGLLECVVALYLLVIGYLHFLVVRTQQMRALRDANEGTQLYFFAILSVQYVFHPLSLICLYLAGEGALRTWAAVFTHEVLPSFPIRLAVLIQDWRQAKKRIAALGLELPDTFEHVGDEAAELRIHSQRPKDGWRESSTIAVEQEFYEILRVERETGSLPIVYVLRKLPPGRVMRGIFRYDSPVPKRGE
jgi:hypothetical protein